jgi:cyclopropane fatty-acyl-phospholipid synthase-like methyltransferase
MTTWVADEARADWDLIVRYVSEELPQGGKVLDFGCYTGGLLERLGARHERYGVEVNRVAADIASQNIGRDLWRSIDDVPDDLRFDIVIAADVIEHFANPKSLIEQLASKLSDNGVLIITTGDADNYLWNRFGANWWYCFYPEHIAFASEKWLHHIAEDAGVSVSRCESFRYRKLGLVRRVSDCIQAYFYGAFPNTYLGLARLLLKAAGRPDLESIPGAGLSRDHLFIVLSRADKN